VEDDDNRLVASEVLVVSEVLEHRKFVSMTGSCINHRINLFCRVGFESPSNQSSVIALLSNRLTGSSCRIRSMRSSSFDASSFVRLFIGFHRISLCLVFVARVLLLVGRMDCGVAVGWMISATAGLNAWVNDVTLAVGLKALASIATRER